MEHRTRSALPHWLGALSIGLAASLFAVPASAAPSPLGGPYIFVGGGVGPRWQRVDGDAARTALAVGPSVELGGDIALFHASVGADLRFMLGAAASGQQTPIDLDVIGNIGILFPTPIVRPFLRFRAGPGWEWAGHGGEFAALLGLDVGLRVRAPGAPIALVLSVSPMVRVIPTALARTAVDIGLRFGLAFP